MLSFLAQATPAATDPALTDPTFWSNILVFVKDQGPSYGMKIIGAILILIIGRFIASLVRNGIKKIMGAREVDPSLIGFVGSLAYFGIMAFTVIAAVAKFGVQTASFVAILGAAGFAVGMALQGTLANFASGVMILLFRPFKSGDVIDAAGVKGKVGDIHIFSTTMITPDNVRIIVPNGKLFGDTIKNFNGYDTRRVDMTIGIGYSSDIGKAMEICLDLLRNDSRVLADPEPMVAVAELADSSVNLVVRPWVNSGDYWGLYFDMNKAMKEAFDAQGIEIPFPQTVVHMQKLEA